MVPSYWQSDDSLWERYLDRLNEADRTLLERVRAALPLAADVSRSDVFLVIPDQLDRFCIALHARPHSMATLYEESPVGRSFGQSERGWLWSAMALAQRRTRIEPEIPHQRGEIAQQVWPVLNAHHRPVAGLLISSNIIERERHKRRDPAFQHALDRFLHMVVAGQIQQPERVPPFLEQDGILFVDHTARYRYLSGQANNVYRRLGYLDDLRGRSVEEVAAGDLQLVQAAWETQECQFAESTVRDRILQRSAIPLLGPPELNGWERLRFWERRPDRYGVLLLVKDVTEDRRKAQELKVKAVMIKEIHHRVKNNLQMLVSIMRMQARRAGSEEARQLLYEAINRILSMSAIHESLSEGEDQVLNLQDVARRIIRYLQQSAVGPARNITLAVEHADPVLLPTSRATTCALIINELLLNALEHGFDQQSTGRVAVSISDCEDTVELRVEDNGRGLPADFTLDTETSLGLDIVRTLVQDDLKGRFTLRSRPQGGTEAVICFPKRFSGG